ncbi:MAG: hypothetical protein AMJ46_04075 [Latescibacteria bacterium DG_63]|nr:MAG: hypothetical protein AMJ46_04075 [Latescibacteria bacterium DG_63]
MEDSKEPLYTQCLVLKEEVDRGDLARMLKSWQLAFQRAGSPYRAFALASTRTERKGTRIWVSPTLAEILDRFEPDWRRYVRQEAAVPPEPSDAIVCVGDQHVLDEIWW